QAASYLAEARVSCDDYLRLFERHRTALLQRGDPPDGYQLTVFATFDLALQRIQDAAAEELLGLLACLAPDAIPRTLLAAAFPDTLRLNDALLALSRHSLLSVGEQAVDVHRLVQAVTWDRLSPEEQARHAARAAQL